MNKSPRRACFYAMVKQLDQVADEVKYRPGTHITTAPDSGSVTFHSEVNDLLSEIDHASEQEWVRAQAILTSFTQELKSGHIYHMTKAEQIKDWLKDNAHLA